ncbi:MAG: pantetheine-phosphate adenylyltransferase [Desulfovibrionaceae bacterium]
MSSIAIYPGTFDPVTNGHKSIVERAISVFDIVIVAVAVQTEKKEIFSIDERCGMLQETFMTMPSVIVEAFSGLLVEYAKEKGSNVIIRGLRATADFDYEFQLALFNSNLDSSIQTLFFMTDYQYLFVSSSMVKSASRLGADISNCVPKHVENKLKERLLNKDTI